MTSCNHTGAVRRASATPISAHEAFGFKGRAGVEFVDPRPMEDIAQTTGKIPGARVVSIDKVKDGSLPAAFIDRTIRIIVSCQAGPLAERTAAALAEQGFGNVNWIRGGTQAWVDAGFPVER